VIVVVTGPLDASTNPILLMRKRKLDSFLRRANFFRRNVLVCGGSGSTIGERRGDAAFVYNDNKELDEEAEERDELQGPMPSNNNNKTNDMIKSVNARLFLSSKSTIHRHQIPCRRQRSRSHSECCIIMIGHHFSSRRQQK
jgi:hypothetical protein